MKINCIIIDDEPLAIDLLTGYVEKVPYLQLKGSFFRPMDAMTVLNTGKIDLIYLDVSMPDLSGIEFLKSLAHPPRVIFVSAHEHFAFQGFEVNAIDYLLKPVPFNRFLLGAERALDVLKNKIAQQHDYIFVKVEHNIVKVPLESIYYIEGYKDYLKIHTDKPNPILTLTTFKSMEDLLPDNFQRIHRSFMISIDKIISFRNSKVYIKNRYIPIGESYSEIFYKTVVGERLQ
ncbi:LytR/AlgR family response regulator transcription factor [Dawidia soli]|uniref:LytTR family DNA-binding domain-containing protein n=1 Tax=Dawidia soli TaxID=2782352 RepID=A0AAP2GC59_9BACT|nr:LytTR family DNA-binding domain-containing protein [Dawidia soli]MBT1685939.1 LytTR family DNA-binding domain-containing protein [Dawidia soli]